MKKLLCISFWIFITFFLFCCIALGTGSLFSYNATVGASPFVGSSISPSVIDMVRDISAPIESACVDRAKSHTKICVSRGRYGGVLVTQYNTAKNTVLIVELFKEREVLRYLGGEELPRDFAVFYAGP